jgi:quercetin dioxygenase-like cupin family protein
MVKAQHKTAQQKEGRTGHESIAGHLTEPLLNFDLSKEIAELHQEETWLRTGHNSKTLVKQPDFRIVLMALKKGHRIEEHKTVARISIQTLSGHAKVRLPDVEVDLPAGHLLTLDRALQHDVEAVEESAVLLTLSWPQVDAKA